MNSVFQKVVVNPDCDSEVLAVINRQTVALLQLAKYQDGRLAYSANGGRFNFVESITLVRDQDLVSRIMGIPEDGNGAEDAVIKAGDLKPLGFIKVRTRKGNELVFDPDRKIKVEDGLGKKTTTRKHFRTVLNGLFILEQRAHFEKGQAGRVKNIFTVQ